MRCIQLAKSLSDYLSCNFFESVLENSLSCKNLVCRDDDPLQKCLKKDFKTYNNLLVLYNLVETQKKHVKKYSRFLI